MLQQFTDWFFGLAKEAFVALWDFVSDVFVSLLDQVLTAVVAAMALIPVPGFMQGGIGSYMGQLGGGTLWMLGACGMWEALALIGAGYAFRFARKIFTLFQW